MIQTGIITLSKNMTDDEKEPILQRGQEGDAHSGPPRADGGIQDGTTA